MERQFLQIQKSLAETATLLTEIRTDALLRPRFLDHSITPASEEAQPPASEEAYTPASEEAHTPASEEANLSRSSELDMDQNKNDDDVISLFGGNDFDTDTDDLLSY